MVGHVFDLFVFYGGALGVGGELLHVGGMFAFLLEFFEVDRASAFEVSFEQAVHHHVGVAAYGAM